MLIIRWCKYLYFNARIGDIPFSLPLKLATLLATLVHYKSTSSWYVRIKLAFSDLFRMHTRIVVNINHLLL